MKNFALVGTIDDHTRIDDFSLCAKADIIEIRYNERTNEQSLLNFLENLPANIPKLLTIRTIEEGGTWDISDEARLHLFQKLAKYFSMMDIELKSSLFTKISRQELPYEKVICSYHNYDITENKETLQTLINKGFSWQADIVKLAVKSNSKEDVSTLTSLVESNEKVCIIPMGDNTSNLRYEFLNLGSVLSYGYLDYKVAEGQLSLQELYEYFN